MNKNLIENFKSIKFIRKIVILILKKVFQNILKNNYNTKSLLLSEEFLKLENEVLFLNEFRPKINLKHKLIPDIEINNNFYDNRCSDKINFIDIKINLNNILNINKKMKEQIISEKPYYKLKQVPNKFITLKKHETFIDSQEKFYRKNKNMIKNKKNKSTIKINLNYNDKLLKEPHTYNKDGTILPIKYSSKKNLKQIFTHIKSSFNISVNKQSGNNINKTYIKKDKTNFFKKLKKIEIKSKISNISFKKINKKAVADFNNNFSINGITKPYVKTNIWQKKLKSKNWSLADYDTKKKLLEKEISEFNNYDTILSTNKLNTSNNLKSFKKSFIIESKKKKSIIIINKENMTYNKKFEVKNIDIFNNLIN